MAELIIKIMLKLFDVFDVQVSDGHNCRYGLISLVYHSKQGKIVSLSWTIFVFVYDKSCTFYCYWGYWETHSASSLGLHDWSKFDPVGSMLTKFDHSNQFEHFWNKGWTIKNLTKTYCVYMIFQLWPQLHKINNKVW